MKNNDKLKAYSDFDWVSNIDDHKSRSGNNVLFLSGARSIVNQ